MEKENAKMVNVLMGEFYDRKITKNGKLRNLEWGNFLTEKANAKMKKKSFDGGIFLQENYKKWQIVKYWMGEFFDGEGKCKNYKVFHMGKHDKVLETQAKITKFWTHGKYYKGFDRGGGLQLYRV